jgi:ribosomal protein L44E
MKNIIKLVCSQCGGHNVEAKAWVDANTNRYLGDAVFDDEDTYCRDCEEHTGLVTEDEFNSSEE